MRALVVCALAVAVCFGQPKPRAFEVASIRERVGPYGKIDIATAGTRLTAEASNLGFLIMWAYDVKNYQLVRSPAWNTFGDAPYDIAAKAEGETAPTKAEFRAMLQALLADRFKLKLHREVMDTRIYALVVGKNGPKLTEATPDETAYARTGVEGRNYVVTMPHHTMGALAEILGNAGLDAPIVNRTGLSGTYDIRLTYTPQYRMSREDPDPAEISVLTAIQNQLGLRLEVQTMPMEKLVIDHVEKPTAN
jgi:uncharacterized protein (TIGR03435 family)